MLNLRYAKEYPGTTILWQGDGFYKRYPEQVTFHKVSDKTVVKLLNHPVNDGATYACFTLAYTYKEKLY